MRPHRLAFSALGPYPGDVEVDFDRLVDDGLFLIWGPTGAGKTFLLDALCFALYGEVPGERRHDTLRSDHAPPDASPCVDLEFTAHDARWRISRSPWHERAKKIGEGTTKVQPKARLERQEGDGWQPVAQKLTEVNDEVTELIGLTASQFQQVVLLPQGRFEKVLRSKSEDREKLLRTLFDTSIFASAANWLDDEAKQRQEEAANFEQELLDLRSRATDRWREVCPTAQDTDLLGTPTDTGDTTVREALVDADAASDGTNESWPANQAQFDDVAGQSRALVGQTAIAETSAEDQLRFARDADEATRRVAELWDQRMVLLQHREELNAATVGIATDEAALELANAAEVMRPLLDGEQSSRIQLQQLASKLSERHAELHENWASAPSTPDGVAVPASDDPALQDRLASMSKSLASHRAQLDKLAEYAKRASERESDAADQRTLATRQREIQREQDEAARELEQQCADAEAKLREAESAVDQTPALRAAAEHARKRSEAATELQSLEPQHRTATEAVQNAKQAALDRREQELDLRARYLEGIAAVLASKLEDSVPCPVCGSTDHPEPAEPAADAVRIEEVEAAEAETRAAIDSEAQAQEALRRIESLRDEARGRAGDMADTPDAAAKQAASAASELEDALSLGERVDEFQKEVATHKSAASDAKEDAKQAEIDANAADVSASAADREATRLRVAIHNEIGEIDPRAAAADVETVESSLGNVQQAAQDRDGACAALVALADSLDAQLKDSCFATVAEARSALRGESERMELRERVDHHKQETYNTERDLGAEEMQGLPDERPDTAAAQAAVDSAEQQANSARDQHTRAEDAYKAINDWADKHRNTTTKHNEAVEDANSWSAVADRCNGRLPPRVSLQRWVLSAYLEQICAFANRRLSSMTGGRYRLGVYRESERRGTQAGLGLRVHDTFTGAEREVSTLSGGETFQASLSLALGVADVVTQRSGGVHLEVLFVDEGFGTLDSEALQLAMDQLDQLREGGRAVGLISHVSELRERIRTGIQVHPTDKGSAISVGAISEL
ncbi:AAA family ATPase [Candidatus Poriferisodalis sp.]|uniref:AAA family ATPase n=1 Tax=Candidatus Poriferisodalis sp. TaxID=3101277 RepID=UPI003B02D30C